MYEGKRVGKTRASMVTAAISALDAATACRGSLLGFSKSHRMSSARRWVDGGYAQSLSTKKGPRLPCLTSGGLTEERGRLVCLWSVSGLSLVCLWSVSRISLVTEEQSFGANSQISELRVPRPATPLGITATCVESSKSLSAATNRVAKAPFPFLCSTSC